MLNKYAILCYQANRARERNMSFYNVEDWRNCDDVKVYIVPSRNKLLTQLGLKRLYLHQGERRQSYCNTWWLLYTYKSKNLKLVQLIYDCQNDEQQSYMFEKTKCEQLQNKNFAQLTTQELQEEEIEINRITQRPFGCKIFILVHYVRVYAGIDLQHSFLCNCHIACAIS